jgi:hypothetical protein
LKISVSKTIISPEKIVFDTLFMGFDTLIIAFDTLILGVNIRILAVEITMEMIDSLRGTSYPHIVILMPIRVVLEIGERFKSSFGDLSEPKRVVLRFILD